VARSVRSLATPDLDSAILLSFVERYLQAQLAGTADSPLICAAGSGTLSVDVDGSIYPCFMFTNKAPLRLGEVGTTTSSDLRRASQAFARRLLRREDDGPRPLMSCAGVNEEFGGAVDRVLPEAAVVNRRLVERLDAEVAPLRSDEERWSWLKTKLGLLRMMAG
jgi:radical SAM protein with 4Fe4S-binding SPASM domain